MTDGASVHASAVLVGQRAVLIRGPSGSGKSRLAFDLILAGRAGLIPTAILVGDDRVHLETPGDATLMVRPATALTGLIEVRGLGIRTCPFAAEALVGLVVDLSAGDAKRLPPPAALSADLLGVKIPRIPVGSGFSALPLVIAALTTGQAASQGSPVDQPLDDCPQGIGNHIRHTIATE